MPTLMEIVFLALVQGLTEWLPISSSGHLVISQKVLTLEAPLLLTILLHFGTALVILIYFRHEVLAVLKAIKQRDWKSENGKMAWLILLGNIPTAAIAFVFYGLFIELFNRLEVVGAALIVTGFVLLISTRANGTRELSTRDALLMGVAQGIAIIPGISRSGFTIVTGLLIGAKKEKTFKFSFLLAVPAIIGATVIEAIRQRDQLTLSFNFMPTFVGVFLAMVVGYVSLTFLWKTIERKKFHLFAYYCFAMGLVVLVSLLVFRIS